MVGAPSLRSQKRTDGSDERGKNEAMDGRGDGDTPLRRKGKIVCLLFFERWLDGYWEKWMNERYEGKRSLNG